MGRARFDLCGMPLMGKDVPIPRPEGTDSVGSKVSELAPWVLVRQQVDNHRGYCRNEGIRSENPVVV